MRLFEFEIFFFELNFGSFQFKSVESSLIGGGEEGGDILNAGQIGFICLII